MGGGVDEKKNFSSSEQDTIFDFIYREDVDSLAKAIDKQPSLLTQTSDNELGPLEFALFHKKSSSVDVLLNRKKCPIRDALFFAILLDDRPTMIRILNMSKKTDVHPISRIFFPCYFTPIMMAAILERDYAYSLLRQFGHSLQSLRLVHCKCVLCLTDGWKDCGPSQLAVIYRHQSIALASESRLLYIGQRDPIQACFVLCRRLDWLIANYSSEESFYLNIRERVCVLMGKFAGCCQTEDEIRMLFQQTGGKAFNCGNVLPRFDMAVSTYQREFLTESLSMQTLHKLWMGSWIDWPYTNFFVRSYRVAMHTILHPLACLLYLLTWGRFPKSFRNPFARYLSFFSSYMLFCIVAFTYTQHGQRDSSLRGWPSSLLGKVTLAYLYLFQLGSFTIICTDLKRMGMERFYYSWWRMLDLFQFFVFGWSFVALTYSTVSVGVDDDISLLPRTSWPSGDLNMQFEVLFAVGLALASMRVIYFLQISQFFGPVLVSLFRTARYVLYYVFFMCLIMFAVAVGLSYLYQNYEGNVATDPLTNENIVQPRYLSSFISTLAYLYWAWYGYMHPKMKLRLVVGHNQLNEPPVQHNLIETAGHLLTALYHAIIIISAMHLMTSLLTAHAAYVIKTQRRDYRFLVCEIWNEYFQNSRTLPPPFCLFHLLINYPVYYKRSFSVDDSLKSHYSIWNADQPPKWHSTSWNRKYEKLIKTLILRVRTKNSREIL
ncbi:Short transient receptor potential channel 4 [Trichinella zimbabwensis]|uniref:Short transient receptor potential channel 4 n=1 Tax=Trichinella zimbabwensis TaxID=268475 RepID=A0A0V1HWL0_9BILA|nr:Short transient receptor potential channel 4 [Trichinella zimbabwensis]